MSDKSGIRLSFYGRLFFLFFCSGYLLGFFSGVHLFTRSRSIVYIYSWRYRLGVALSIDIPYLRALFIALSLMVQVVASLLFFCLFVFLLFFIFPFCLLGNFFFLDEGTLIVFAPILVRLLLLSLPSKRAIARGGIAIVLAL